MASDKAIISLLFGTTLPRNCISFKLSFKKETLYWISLICNRCKTFKMYFFLCSQKSEAVLWQSVFWQNLEIGFEDDIKVILWLPWRASLMCFFMKCALVFSQRVQLCLLWSKSLLERVSLVCLGLHIARPAQIVIIPMSLKANLAFFSFPCCLWRRAFLLTSPAAGTFLVTLNIVRMQAGVWSGRRDAGSQAPWAKHRHCIKEAILEMKRTMVRSCQTCRGQTLSGHGDNWDLTDLNRPLVGSQHSWQGYRPF